MAQTICGHIPEKINIHFTDIKVQNIGTDNLYFSPESILDIDPKDKSIIQEVWGFVDDAKDSHPWGTRQAHSFSTIKNNRLASVLDISNDHIKNIRIINRFSHFGGAKVLIEDSGGNKYISHLEQDVLMDSVINGKILKGGIIIEDYVWACIRSKMKIIRVAGEVYQKIIRYQASKQLSKINKNNFIPGSFYKTLSGDTAMFVGVVDTTLLERDPKLNWVIFFSDEKFNNFTSLTRNKVLLFLEVKKSKRDNLKELKIEDHYRWGSPLIKMSHSFIEDTKVNHKIDLNLKETIKKSLIRSIVKKLSSPHFIKNDLKYSLISNSGILNMRSCGDTNFKLFDIKKYLNFV